MSNSLLDVSTLTRQLTGRRSFLRLPVLIWGLFLLGTLAACGPMEAPTPPVSEVTPSLRPTSLPTDVSIASTPAFVSSGEPIPMPKMSVETHQLADSTLDAIQQTGAKLVRYNALIWSEVESVEEERNWDAVADLETGLEAAAARNLDVILIVRGAPPWAQSVEGFDCSAVKPEKIEAFAQFMRDAVARYSAPPFNVRYWELGNEPDVPASAVPENTPYGCWGDENDAYYGGGYYGEMLKTVYPVVKAADPQAQVLTGGLLLDCDPTHPPEGKDCKSAKFLEGIIQNGAGDFFDVVSFHGYPPYFGETFGVSGLYGDEHFQGWEDRGGVVLGKISYLRDLMASYGIDKPLMHTEASLICPEWNTAGCNPPEDAFYESQADYVVWLYVRNWAAGVGATVWYLFEGPGWRFGGLLDENQAPKPAYYAFTFLTSELSGSSYVGRVQLDDGLRGYAFAGAEKDIWVVWSADEASREIALPANWRMIYDKYGNPLTPAEGNVIPVQSPIYIEISP